MKRIFAAYKLSLQKRPVITKSITCGALFAVGDYFAQRRTIVFYEVVDNDAFGWDKNRTEEFVIVGVIYYGPALHLWYCKILPNLANLCFKGRTKLFRVTGSVCLDQVFFTPLFYCGYYMVDAIVEQRSIIQGASLGLDLIRSKMIQTLVADLLIWPLATGINLWYIPLQYQVLFNNIICLFWDAALCHITKG